MREILAIEISSTESLIACKFQITEKILEIKMTMYEYISHDFYLWFPTYFANMLRIIYLERTNVRIKIGKPIKIWDKAMTLFE